MLSAKNVVLNKNVRSSTCLALYNKDYKSLSLICSENINLFYMIAPIFIIAMCEGAIPKTNVSFLYIIHKTIPKTPLKKKEQHSHNSQTPGPPPSGYCYS